MLGRRGKQGVESAIGLESTIRKSGYLVKRAKKSGANWRDRYFVLSSSCLTYYKDHKHTQTAKGDILLTPDATISEVNDDAQHPFSLAVTTPFTALRLAAKSDEDRKAWRAAIEEAIQAVGNTLRDYLNKKGQMLESPWVRKFFILHDDCLTYHVDHMHTSRIQGMIKFTPETTIDFEAEAMEMTINSPDADGGETRMVLQGEEEEKIRVWHRSLQSIITRLKSRGGTASAAITDTIRSTALMTGALLTRPTKGGDFWDERFYILTNEKLYMLEAEDSTDALHVFTVHPSCSVFETNLKANAFELVTSQMVLHVSGLEQSAATEWIATLRRAIAESRPDENDPLLQAALRKAEEDEYYEVTFHTKKPLGVVLERSGEWAVVKLSNYEETQVSVGSALHSINNESVVLRPYMETIRMLTGWRPPLTLGFRKAPERRGWLTKQARARRGKIKNWKPRYFVLAEGRLSYYDTDEADAQLKGEVQLMGSAVSLLSYAETGQYFCFRLVSGITSLVMQGLTVEDMNEWAATLYHAIALANGGAYLLDMERRREEEAREREEEERKEQEAIEAKRKAKRDAEAAERKRLHDEREAAALAAEQEAERQRQAELEAERLKEQQEKEAAEAAEREAREAAERAEAARVAAAAAVAAEEEAARRREEEEAAAKRAEEEAAAKKAEEEAAALKAAEEARLREEEEKRQKAQKDAEEAAAAEERARVAAAVATAAAVEEEEEELRQKEEEATAAAAKKQEEEAAAAAAAAEAEAAGSPQEEDSPVTAESGDAKPEEDPALQSLAVPLGGALDGTKVEQDDDDDDDDTSDDDDDELSTGMAGSEGEGERPSERVFSDGEDEDEKEFAAHQRAGDEAGGVMRVEHGALSNDELSAAFAALDVGTHRGQLNSMQFSNLRRLLTGEQNMFQEMKMFTLFDKDGSGKIDLEDFMYGFRLLEERDGLDNMYTRNLRKMMSGESTVL